MKRSWQSYLINGFLRLAVKRRLRVDSGLEQLRVKVKKIDSILSRTLADVKIDRIDMNGVACERLRVPQSRDDRVLFYIHGGGFVLNIMSAHRDTVARWCKAMRCVAYIPRYRLAPEHPCPAPQDDCLHAYQWLLKNGASASNLVVAGESAGGAMTLSLMQRIRQRSLPMPACAILMSPATDLTISGESAITNERQDPMFTLQALLMMRNAHTREQSVAEPVASPLFGDFEGLPPLKILAGSTEMLLSDSLRAAEKARNAGVKVEMDVWTGMPHAFPLLTMLPESQLAQNVIGDFVSDHAGWT